MLCPQCGKDVGDNMTLCPSCTTLAEERREDIANVSARLSIQAPPEDNITEPQSDDAQPIITPYLTEPSSLDRDAGFWLRVFASLVDSCLFKVSMWTFGLLIAAALEGVASYAEQSPEQAASIAASVGIIIAILVFLMFALYFVVLALFESSRLQATPGKLLVGLKVQNIDGTSITFFQALGRNLGKFLSAATIGLGYVMAGFTERKQALHDLLASTYVVKDHRVPETRRIGACVMSVVLTAIIATIDFNMRMEAQQDAKKFSDMEATFDDSFAPSQPQPQLQPLPEPIPASPPPANAPVFEGSAVPENPIKDLQQKESDKPPVEEPTGPPPLETNSAALGETVVNFLDHVALIDPQYQYGPNIEVGYYRKTLSTTQKRQLRNLQSLSDFKTMKRVGVPTPDLVVSLLLKRNARSCNEYTMHGVYLDFVSQSGGFQLSGKKDHEVFEVIYTNWFRFQKESGVRCVFLNGNAALAGTLKGEQAIKKTGELIRWNLVLDTPPPEIGIK